MKLDKFVRQAEVQAENLKLGLQEMYSQIGRMQERQRQLEAAGMVEARPHWHQNVYLYLYRPMKDGVRPREYIGRNPDKIKAALEKVERFEEHKKLDKSLSDLKNIASAIKYNLDTAANALKDADRLKLKG